jgi:hypothetical protein
MIKFNQLILSLFLIIIVSVPVYWLTGGEVSEQISIVEGRELAGLGKTYPTLKNALEYIRNERYDLAVNLVWDLFLNRSLQIKFDNAAIDQFPFRIHLIMFSKTMDLQLIKFVYQFSKDHAIPADMTSDLYIFLEQNALIPAPQTLDDISFSIIDDRIENYHAISTLYPDINVYVYLIETIQSSPLHPLTKYFPYADNGRAYDYFKSSISDQITVGAMRIEDVDDHVKYFYRTDHHWNTIGIIKGYNDIFNLLSKNYQNIPERLTPSAMITFPEIEFLGTYARRSLYPIHGDAFIGFEADFPSCIVKDQGIEGVFDKREEYLAGNYLTTPYISHYGLYFGSQKGLLEYDCETDTEQNILILGDSYARPLISLLASQYHHTYFLDLRVDDGFVLSEFFKQHSVDDLLIVGGLNVVFLDNEHWHINP